MHTSNLFAPVLLTLAVSATPVPQISERFCSSETQVLSCCPASDDPAILCLSRKALYLGQWTMLMLFSKLDIFSSDT